MDFNQLSPYVRVAMHSSLNAPFLIRERIIFDYELIFLESGHFRLDYCGQSYFCSPGDVLLICPGRPHSFHCLDGESISQPHVHFDLIYDEKSPSVYISFKNLPEFNEKERALIRPDLLTGFLDAIPRLHMPEPELFRALLFEIIDLFQSQPEYAPLLLKQKMLALLQMVFRHNLRRQSVPAAEDAVFTAIREYIERNVQNNITLEHLATFFHYNKFYIAKRFRRLYGISVIRYANNARLEAAKRLLRETGSVTQTANQLNFRSIYAFSRFFKANAGQPPRNYIKTFANSPAQLEKREMGEK